MPVQGLPDPEVHRRCFRCEQWFEEDEVRPVARSSHGYASGIANAIRSAAGDSNWRYVCAECEVKGRYRFAKLIGVLLLLLGLSWAMRELGWL